jgi:TRAP-type mannitol/chloroaromatic compound transport system permease small subunit
MKKALFPFFKTVDTLCRNLGATAGLLIMVMMLTSSYEVLARYAFNSPTIWVWLLNRQLFGVFILLAGSYTLSQESHIRIEILFDRFPENIKVFARWVSFLAFLCFMGVLIWQGVRMGHNAWMVKEKSTGALRMPLYPLKMFIPVASFLFMLEGIYVFLLKPGDEQKELKG